MRFCPRCGSRYEHERFCPEDGAPTQDLPDAGPPSDSIVGSLVDQRYRIDAQIGEGGMGVVYKATHVALNKVVALKVLRGEMAKDPEVVQRFMQEAQSASAIGHENIIDIHDFGKLPDGTAYFVMEFLNGLALSDLIKRGGSIPVGDAVQILRQIAGALGAAHQRGIVHRDLKPDNVIVLTRGELTNFVKVLDFGIAKVGASKNKLTRTGMVFGTPHYMSPEQAAGQGVDARTDIYALGVIMYEMFTGHVPFDADTFMGVLTKHMFEKPAPMFSGDSERRLGSLETITLRALEKKPENRYESMQDMVDDLDQVLGGGRPRAVAGQRASSELADALEPRSKDEVELALQAEREQHEEPEPEPASEQVEEPPVPAPAQFQYESDSPPELPSAPRWPLYVGAVSAAIILAGVVVFLREDAKPVASKEEPAPVAASESADSVADAAPAAAAPNTPIALDRETNIGVRSSPGGAEVWEGGKLIGKTPLDLPRPPRGERTLEVHFAGYKDSSIVLRAGSPEMIDVALVAQPIKAAEPAKTPKVPARKDNKKPAQAAQAEPSRKPSTPTPAEPAKPKRKRLTSEVVDPWAE